MQSRGRVRPCGPTDRQVQPSRAVRRRIARVRPDEVGAEAERRNPGTHPRPLARSDLRDPETPSASSHRPPPRQRHDHTRAANPTITHRRARLTPPLHHRAGAHSRNAHLASPNPHKPPAPPLCHPRQPLPPRPASPPDPSLVSHNCSSHSLQSSVLSLSDHYFSSTPSLHQLLLCRALSQDPAQAANPLSIEDRVWTRNPYGDPHAGSRVATAPKPPSD
jgi:hypothetical protein